MPEKLKEENEEECLFSSCDRKYLLEVLRSSEVCLFMGQQRTTMKSYNATSSL